MILKKVDSDSYLVRLKNGVTRKCSRRRMKEIVPEKMDVMRDYFHNEDNE